MICLPGTRGVIHVGVTLKSMLGVLHNIGMSLRVNTLGQSLKRGKEMIANFNVKIHSNPFQIVIPLFVVLVVLHGKPVAWNL